jgi:carbon storage regulator
MNCAKNYGFLHIVSWRDKEVWVMLVLGRNLGDTIIINENITIKFMKGKGADFKVAIDAPKEVKIVRGEVDERQKEREAKFAYLDS